MPKLRSGKQNGTDRESKWCAGAGTQWIYHSKLRTQDNVLKYLCVSQGNYPRIEGAGLVLNRNRNSVSCGSPRFMMCASFNSPLC